MEPSNFNLDYRRKILRKRKKRRQIITSAILISLILFPLILSIKSESNFITTIQKVDDSDKKEFIVCIDAGHGDWDAGTVGVSGCEEKDIALNIALKLGELLSSEDDIKVIYTRTSDSLPWLKTANDSLKERIKISNLANANLFISLHCNSNYDDTNAKGVETWYNPSLKANEDFASYLQHELSSLNYTTNRGLKFYEDKEALFTEPEQIREIERVVLLKVIDRKWMDHIDDMDQLKQGIGLQAYGQKDPVIQYKMMGYDMFDTMTQGITEDTVRLLMHIQVEQKVEREQVAKVTGTNKDDGPSVKGPVKRVEKKIYPNDPCPCGSGKKYKNCCGRQA